MERNSELKSVSRRMRADWNRRARSDPRYYVALGQPDQTWEEFFSGANDLVLALEKELVRLPKPDSLGGLRALEIGCGPGRLMLPLSRHFSEIHGVDVSAEMVRLAAANLNGIAHAHVHVADGASLTAFDAEFFDFVYSYAVFQHIPSRDVVLNYMKESRRVLRTGGIARMQFNGLPQAYETVDTWSGVRFTASEIAAFARDHDLQLLALEGSGTQYMWGTFAKRTAGWYNALMKAEGDAQQISIQKITHASSSEPVVPVRGRYAAFALWMDKLSPDADLNNLRVLVGGLKATLTSIGASAQNGGLIQVSALLPGGLTTGLQPVQLIWANTVCHSKTWLRAVPAAPEAPCIVSVTDSVRVGLGRTISCGMVRISLEGTDQPNCLKAFVDGREARVVGLLCSAPGIPRFEIDFEFPLQVSAGSRTLECHLGWRYLGAFDLNIASDRSRFGLRDFYRSARLKYFSWTRKGRPKGN